jgi:hypothetical protein
MARTIASVGREKTIATLARNLFVVEGPNASELQRRAEGALLAANPRLAQGLTAGAAVVVPAVPGLRPSARAAATSSDLAGLVAETALRLRTAAASAENGFAQSQKRAEAALAQLGDRQFVAAATKALPASRTLIEEAGKAIKQRQATERATREALVPAIEKALAELDALAKRAARSAPE